MAPVDLAVALDRFLGPLAGPDATGDPNGRLLALAGDTRIREIMGSASAALDDTRAVRAVLRGAVERSDSWNAVLRSTRDLDPDWWSHDPAGYPIGRLGQLCIDSRALPDDIEGPAVAAVVGCALRADVDLEQVVRLAVSLERQSIVRQESSKRPRRGRTEDAGERVACPGCHATIANHIDGVTTPRRSRRTPRREPTCTFSTSGNRLLIGPLACPGCREAHWAGAFDASVGAFP